MLCVVRGICVGLITRAGESYRLCGVSECDPRISTVRRPWPKRGCREMKNIHHHRRVLTSVNSDCCAQYHVTSISQNKTHREQLLVAKTIALCASIQFSTVTYALSIDRSPFQGFTFGHLLYERGQYLDRGAYLVSPSFGLSRTAGTFQYT